MVGFTLSAFIIAAVGIAIRSDRKEYKDFSTLVLYCVGVYGGIGVVQLLFYPVGGLLADLRFGRYRTVLCSLGSLWCSYVCLTVMTVIFLANGKHLKHLHPVIGVLSVLQGLCTIIGFVGFQANSVQFGLDQLLDSPSAELSVFLHWFVWMDVVGTFLAQILGAVALCNESAINVIEYFPFVILLGVTALALLTCWKRGWFHSEPRTHNPYGTVYRVLKYVAQHDKPVRRSAFAYCDDERPMRMDFAKERFGGPFSTETVENVKTFLRILLTLLAIGPVFCLHVSNVYVFPLFGMHGFCCRAATSRTSLPSLFSLSTSSLSTLTSQGISLGFCIASEGGSPCWWCL